MRKHLLVATLITSVVFAVALTYEQPIPVEPELEPVIVEQPKQSPYVIYVYVCEELQGVIVTSEPLMSFDKWTDSDPDPKMMIAMVEAKKAGRDIFFQGEDYRGCPKQERT